MCDVHGGAYPPAVDAIPADADWSGEVLNLEPVDEISVLTVCDNTIDVLLTDEGPARRLGPGSAAGAPTLDAPTLIEGKVVDAPLAQHGFSVLAEIRKGETVGCCSTPASRRTAASRTCGASAGTSTTSR